MCYTCIIVKRSCLLFMVDSFFSTHLFDKWVKSYHQEHHLFTHLLVGIVCVLLMRLVGVAPRCDLFKFCQYLQETTYAKFNSSLHSCYPWQSTMPGSYKMMVTVFDVETPELAVARKSLDFVITGPCLIVVTFMV